MNAPSSKPRLLELDAFRGIAAVAVVLFHYTTRYQELYGHVSPPLFFFSYGYYGVDLFFMISGFVIFMTLEKTRHAADFMVSRFSRLYPAYWAAIVLTFTLVHVLGLPGREVTLRDALINLTMFQEFFKTPHVDGVYWTLQVEMLFYLLMLGLYQVNWLKYMDGVLFAWLGLRLVYSLAGYFWHIDLPFIVYKIFILQFIPYFAMGIVFFRLRHGTILPMRACAFIVACLLLIVLGEGWRDAIAATLCVLAFYVFVRGRAQWLGHSVFVYFGTISYSLYLLHENIGWALMRRFESFFGDANLSVALTLICALALATALTYTIEKPALRFLRERYRRRQVARTH